MPKMRWAFFGTDEFAVGVLEQLKTYGSEWLPDLIVSTPDKPKGRKLILTPSPVSEWTKANNINVITPASLKAPLDFESEEWDLFLVASYGKIIPSRLLTVPKHQILNIHPSLLPKHRGPSPLETTILNGDQESGVSLMIIDELVDHGPVIAQEKVAIDEAENYLTLRHKLASLGAKLFADTVPAWLSGKLTPAEQDHDQATLTRKFTKEDGLLELTGKAIENYRKIRAFVDWPGTYFFVNNKRVKINRAHMENGALIIDRVTPEGKSEMSWADYARNL